VVCATSVASRRIWLTSATVNEHSHAVRCQNGQRNANLDGDVLPARRKPDDSPPTHHCRREVSGERIAPIACLAPPVLLPILLPGSLPQARGGGR
jgi:hypothetical protein